MKLSIAGRMGGTVLTDEDAQEFARKIQAEADHDEWVRVLYAVSTPDTAEVEVLSFRLEPTG